MPRGALIHVSHLEPCVAHVGVWNAGCPARKARDAITEHPGENQKQESGVKSHVCADVYPSAQDKSSTVQRCDAWQLP
eukprot:3549476-Rhodomonas_salina.1